MIFCTCGEQQHAGTPAMESKKMTTALPRIVTKKELRLMVPYTPQHILRLEKQNKFPRRIRIGERRVGWRLSDIEAWLAQRERQSSLLGQGA
jgi:prophage regulatory protein